MRHHLKIFELSLPCLLGIVMFVLSLYIQKYFSLSFTTNLLKAFVLSALVEESVRIVCVGILFMLIKNKVTFLFSALLLGLSFGIVETAFTLSRPLWITIYRLIIIMPFHASLSFLQAKLINKVPLAILLSVSIHGVYNYFMLRSTSFSNAFGVLFFVVSTAVAISVVFFSFKAFYSKAVLEAK